MDICFYPNNEKMLFKKTTPTSAAGVPFVLPADGATVHQFKEAEKNEENLNFQNIESASEPWKAEQF